MTALLNGRSAQAVREVLRAVEAYLYLPDDTPVLFALAVAVARTLGGEPLWGLIVAPPSSAKTECLRLLDKTAAERWDDLTAAGLLSWTAGKNPRKVGALLRLPENALVTIGDLSTLIARSDQGMKEELFALLRRAYDGQVTRNLGQASGPLEWRGRITLLGAVTSSIDRYSSHADALGPRWTYLRLPELSAAQEREARRFARDAQDQLTEHREHAAFLASRCVAAACERVAATELSVDADEAIGEAAQVAALGRGAVERAGRGQREILGEAEREGTARLYGQLRHLARGLMALGLSEVDCVSIATRAALDSIPRTRWKVLHALSEGEAMTAAAIARAEASTQPTVRRACEDFEALGALRGEREQGRSENSPNPWRLTGEDAGAVSRVFERLRGCRGLA